MIFENENWRPIPDLRGLYEVSDFGRVRSLQKGYFGHILTPQANHRGYFKVALMVNGKRKYRLIHRIVADAFLPLVDGAYFVDHRDRNKANNGAKNLRRCTNEQNFLWAVEDGAIAQGFDHRRAKLTPDQVEAVRIAKQSGRRFWGAKQLAEEFGVCEQTINSAARGFTYREAILP